SLARACRAAGPTPPSTRRGDGYSTGSITPGSDSVDTAGGCSRGTCRPRASVSGPVPRVELASANADRQRVDPKARPPPSAIRPLACVLLDSLGQLVEQLLRLLVHCFMPLGRPVGVGPDHVLRVVRVIAFKRRFGSRSLNPAKRFASISSRIRAGSVRAASTLMLLAAA